MCGEPIYKVDRVIGINKQGWPRCLGRLQYIADRGTTWEKRYLLTLVNYTKALDTIGLPTLESITTPSTSEGYVETEVANWLPEFINSFHISSYSGRWMKSNAALSTKAGPHGLATWTAWKTAFHIPDELKSSLAVVGGTELTGVIDDIRKSFPEVVSKVFTGLKFKNREGLRVLAYVNDPELKTRVVAILDWYSQEALRPFHEYLFDILKRIPMDRTFTQAPYITNKPVGHNFHSLDLSSATDRFPMSLQAKLVAALTSDEFSNAWKHILIGYPYEATKPLSGLHYYKAGQPMGGYSSWSTFTLCHHLVVYAAHRAAGVDPVKDPHYILLGDDIVIYHDDVAKHYKRLIRGLGVEVSNMKTHTSPKTYEFAKRWFHEGIEITGIPVKGFASNVSKVHILYMNLKALYQRGYYTLDYNTIPCLISDLLSTDDSLSEKMIKNLVNRVEGLDAIHRYVHDDDKETLNTKLRLSLPEGVPVPSSLELALREGMNDVLAANVNELSDYTNRFMLRIRKVCEGLADKTNGWIPNVPQYGKLPVTLALFVRTRENVQKLVMPAMAQPLKEIIKTVSLDDPERITTVRSSVKIFGSESRLYKKLFSTILESSKENSNVHVTPAGQRAHIALVQMQMLNALINPTNPMAPLTLGVYRKHEG